MSLEFSIIETMRGVHHFVDPVRGPAVDRPFHFRIKWGAPIKSSLNPLSGQFMNYDAEGKLFADGLTTKVVACRGSLAVDYFNQHTISYKLDFEGQGTILHFVGHKTDVRLSRPLLLVKTHTTCYGMITDDAGTILSRSVVHFPPEMVLSLLRSFRLRWA